jgi:hypothetical protein
MRAEEFITERMETTWIRPWVAAAVAKVGAYKNNIEWYKKFFDNLNKSKELKQWRKANIEHPLTIEPKLVEDKDSDISIIDGSHVISNQPVQHKVFLTVNTAHAPVDEKSTATFVDRVGSFLVHELNHAYQSEQQLKKIKDPDAVINLNTTIWAKQPPAAITERDKYYVYILNNIEKDAWTGQIANDIQNVLGKDSLKYLENILKQAQTQDYAVVKSRIIQIPGLKAMYDAAKYYNIYLKGGKEAAWNKIKKELYRYLSKYE